MEQLRGILRQVWGFESFRPLQAESMRSVVEGRDSVVVLPTGGGKSLCFQAPALAMDGVAVVLSPLISLMKDQIDALRDNGVAAASVNSAMSAGERQQVANDVRAGRLKLLYMSPERLMNERTLDFLHDQRVSFFAIDEAHCISDWGHDFRPEYRMLRALKEQFPEVGVHAYTATATPRVREDIARELHLRDPEILVGSFDRPNLNYRVVRRKDVFSQLRDVVERFPDDSGIVYCIRRADVDELCARLCAAGYAALPYHAGLGDDDRRRNQDGFINDRARIIVATVAFGMGIDKSNVRYVIHAASPKSLEAYQQESGRAGRDGLEAECWLFWSPQDFLTWRKIQQDLPPDAYQVAMEVLQGIDRYCSALECRHRLLVRHFGQDLEAKNCGACDVCLGGVELIEDRLIIAQKILSCVLRLKESFGAEYTSQVLIGDTDEKIATRGHDRLSTYGLLREHDKRHIREWIDQLQGQGFLVRAGEYNVLQVTQPGWQVLRGETLPMLAKPHVRERKSRKTARTSSSSSTDAGRIDLGSWEGVDRELFDALRKLRRQKADEKGLPPFIVFGDATLRDMARRRPSTLPAMRHVHGVGDKKLADYGTEFVAAIVEHCERTGVALDANVEFVEAVEPEPEEAPAPKQLSPIKATAFAMFAMGKSLEAVQQATGRALSTTAQYLFEFIEDHRISDASPWLDTETFRRISLAGLKVGTERLKPIFDELGGDVSYDQIRIAIGCLRNVPSDE
ncbi:MAG: DNA helicase RecQ [Planctomycetia bacterium]|nr:DNA helicase RecQ [Planctomycetia bacterium]